MSEFVDFIDIEVAYPFPTPQVMAGRIEALADDLRDLTPALEASKAAVSANIEEHFDNETGPNGEKWQPWSDSYAPVAQRTNKSILRRDDFLFDAATDESNYDVVGNDLFIDTSNFPPYWRIQQLGGLTMDSSSVVRRQGQRRRGEQLDGRIPARPYLGLNDEARLKIVGYFDLWMQGAIARFVTNPRTGHTQPIFTIAGGRPTFGKAFR